MTFKEFHNALRVMRSLDSWELDGVLDDAEWMAFQADPYKYFIQAPTHQANALFGVISQRAVASNDVNRDLFEALSEIVEFESNPDIARWRTLMERARETVAAAKGQ